MDKLRLAVVGLNFGAHIVEELRTGSGEQYFELAGVCDLDAEKADRMAHRLGVPAYHSLEELLEQSDVPTVGLFTGPQGRAELIQRIIRSGRDVMTTKPFELDPDAAENILHEAREAGRVVHLNSPAPLPTDDLQQVKRWREEHELGRPVACRAETWASYREEPDGSWQDDPDRCPVAPIFRLGIYLINDLIHLFGHAESVQVTSSRLFTGRPTPDNAQLGIRFESGALANVFASFCIQDGLFYRNSLTLNYQNGTVYRNVGPVEAGRRKTTCMEVVSAHDPQNPLITRAEPENRSGEYRWDLFHRAVQGQKLEGEVSPEDVAEGIRIIRAMRQSEKSGHTEPVH
jgi:predicted dehydrogenase